jgi:Fe-S-cluster containining protein
MIAIDDVLISGDIIDENFKCNLSACKGACCWEGDYGAPMEKEEADAIQDQLPNIINHLSEEAKSVIEKNGVSTYYDEADLLGTPLLKDNSCVFLVKQEVGFSYCAIEHAYKKGEITVNKPISCHLYPIRVTKNKLQKFEAWNYDRWDICSPACKQGRKDKVKVYEFLKEAIIRYKGEDFYNQLEEAADL